MSTDPREQPVSAEAVDALAMAHVDVDLDRTPFLVLVQAPLDGATDASIHRAKVAQRQERQDALLADADRAADDLRASQYTDALFAELVAKALHGMDISQADRRQAGAVAVRLHDPIWQTISRYRAAVVVEMILRNLLSQHGMSSMIPDRALREAADSMAGAARQGWLKALDGSLPVHAHEWARARLGFLRLTEDR